MCSGTGGVELGGTPAQHSAAGQFSNGAQTTQTAWWGRLVI